MRLPVSLGFLAIASACHTMTHPGDRAFLRGTIVSRSPQQIFVQGTPEPGDHSCSAAARLNLSDRTVVHDRAGTRAPTDALQPGISIAVWVYGAVALSCPPIAHADFIVIQ